MADGVCVVQPGEPHPGLDKCLELKTNMVIESEKQENIFHKSVTLMPRSRTKLIKAAGSF